MASGGLFLLEIILSTNSSLNRRDSAMLVRESIPHVPLVCSAR